MSATDRDIEAHLDEKASIGEHNALGELSRGGSDISSIDEIKRTKEVQSKVPILRQLRKGEEWLDSKVGIELRGIDRVPEEEKQPPSIWNVFLLWWSLNVHVGVIVSYYELEVTL